jgi:hypothetical protein
MHAKARRSRAAYKLRVGRQHVAPVPDCRTALDCGWGRLLFAQTYPDGKALAAALLEEGPERRDIAAWVRDPHLVLAAAPQALFLDPSHTYRLDLSTYRASRKRARGFVVRWVTSQADADAVSGFEAGGAPPPSPKRGPASAFRNPPPHKGHRCCWGLRMRWRSCRWH